MHSFTELERLWLVTLLAPQEVRVADARVLLEPGHQLPTPHTPQVESEEL